VRSKRRGKRKKRTKLKRKKHNSLLPAVVQLELGVGEELVPVEKQREGLEVDVAGLLFVLSLLLEEEV
jgi:hypothetical protein